MSKNSSTLKKKARNHHSIQTKRKWDLEYLKKKLRTIASFTWNKNKGDLEYLKKKKLGTIASFKWNKIGPMAVCVGLAAWVISHQGTGNAGRSHFGSRFRPAFRGVISWVHPPDTSLQNIFFWYPSHLIDKHFTFSFAIFFQHSFVFFYFAESIRILKTKTLINKFFLIDVFRFGTSQFFLLVLCSVKN